MAKYAPSALIGRLSRSAGATTFAHNRFGAYLRNRVIPTNPVTSFQTAARTALSNASIAWRTLTAAQRALWTAYGENFVRTDSLGQTYNLPGINTYVSVNRNVALYGGTQLSDPPAYAPPDALTSASAAVTEADTAILTFTATPLPASTKLLIYATRPLSAGINFQQNGAYKHIATSAAAQATSWDITSQYTARYGSLGLAGEKILFKAIVVTADGLASPALQFSTIVQA